jgi:hypothetical protein
VPTVGLDPEPGRVDGRLGIVTLVEHPDRALHLGLRLHERADESDSCPRPPVGHRGGHPGARGRAALAMTSTPIRAAIIPPDPVTGGRVSQSGAGRAARRNTVVLHKRENLLAKQPELFLPIGEPEPKVEHQHVEPEAGDGS